MHVVFFAPHIQHVGGWRVSAFEIAGSAVTDLLHASAPCTLRDDAEGNTHVVPVPPPREAAGGVAAATTTTAASSTATAAAASSSSAANLIVGSAAKAIDAIVDASRCDTLYLHLS